ncbi:MAG: glycosyltransferase family 9 protein [Sphingomonas sp.]|uniref:glycosyltransferase family 9 protein n=1 Tax=Sphingomonas sp. TaxID=28214 RepID=UPI0025CD3C1B|nr:glycosyltransferase family 9 protein [Sphingomonas sp.]MBX9880435.1 glycosyltransferase family 9 protein [Sphingomonas sp.]
MTRALAIRLDAMGDVLMTTPALRAMRAHVDNLTLLTSPAGAGVAALVPEVDAVIAYEAPWMKAGAPHPAEADHALVQRLAAQQFDIAVVFTVFSQTPFPAAMLAHLAGIPRIAAHVRERAYKLVSDAVDETEPERGIRHEAQRQLDLVASLGWRSDDTRLGIAVPEAARQRVAPLLPPGRWMAVSPGASAPSRRYPPALFGAALRQLAGEGWRFLVTGSGEEASIVDAVIAAAGAGQSLAGQLSLAELAAVIAAAPVLIANNSGPAHLAAAVGTPLVDLYALTNPQHTPWQVPHRVLWRDVACRWCYASVCKTGHHLCLEGVAPDQVATAARELAALRLAA